jgi:SNF2 family DNA or RNA helicase
MISFTTPATMTWFVSASISSLFTNDGLVIGNDSWKTDKEDQKKTIYDKVPVGPFKIPAKVLHANTVDVDPVFISESFPLPPYLSKQIVCDDKVINDAIGEIVKRSVNLFAGDKKSEALVAAVSNDWRSSLRLEGYNTTKPPKNEVDLYNTLVEYWKKKLEETKEKLVILLKKEDPNDEILKNIKELDTLINKLNQQLTGIITFPESPNTKYYKIEKVGQLCLKLCETNTKTIVYSSDMQAISELNSYLTLNNIKFVDLDGGTPQKMAQAIESYNDGNVNIFLFYSAMFNCGTNLESTEHVIFMQKCTEAVKKQVIGRAQRPKRKNILTVTEVFYECEC